MSNWIGVTENYDIYEPQPTTSDDQCHVNYFSDLSFNPACWAIDRSNPNLNLDSRTCTYYKGRCYSNTAKQCKNASDCSFSLSGCNNNKGGGSLNCRAGFFNCKCISK